MAALFCQSKVVAHGLPFIECPGDDR